jgi:hypothetical protein
MSAMTGFSQSKDYNPSHLYSVDELQADVKFLQATLEKKHPNLYLYTPKEKLNLFFDSLYRCIVEPLSELEFYNLVTLINSKIKDGHTMLLPGTEAVEYYNESSKFLPFNFSILNERLYVNMNCSSDSSIKEGAEILRLNGSDAKDIIKFLFTRQIRDGYNQTYPIWILTTYFKEYYGFSFGHPNTYTLMHKTTEADSLTTTINALPKDSIRFYRQSRYANRNSISTEKKGITLQIDKHLSTATLGINSFDGDILRSVYNQNFKKTMKESFKKINEEHIQNLILDIRNNQGGDFETGKFLLSYLLRESITYLPYCREKQTIRPKKNSFKGNIYVLINGGSFSSSVILCSYLEATKRAIFIGEETGGNKTIISGNSIDEMLPKTKIIFQVSTTKYAIEKRNNLGHGIIPTYKTNFTIDDIINEKDITKELALDIISKTKK